MQHLDSERWRARLDDLANSQLAQRLRDLPGVLEENPEAQWLCLDACGIALLGTLRAALPTLLPGWQTKVEDFALVSESTTTDACYRAIAARGITHAFHKINAIDELLHERFLDFDDLCRIAVAELHARIRPLRETLDGSKPLLCFADHGFRIAPDGQSYRHGGPSTLERVVPVLELTR